MRPNQQGKLAQLRAADGGASDALYASRRLQALARKTRFVSGDTLSVDVADCAHWT